MASKQTLLDMVQSILASLDSEEVNSIDDTVESNQVALIIKGVYLDMLSDIALPERRTLVQLNASLDSTKPCIMYVPDNCIKVYEIQYDNKQITDTYSNYQPLHYKEFTEFVKDQQTLATLEEGVASQVLSLHGESFNILYRTDRMPTCYTHIDDQTILFDSYDVTIDDTLQKSKTLCIGSLSPTFEMTNSFTPEIDGTQFSYLINKAKVRAFNELKQQVNSEADSAARRQKIIIQKRKRKTPDTPSEVYRVQSRFGRK